MPKINVTQLSNLGKKNKRNNHAQRLLPGTIITIFILTIVLLTVFQATDGFTTMVDTEPAKIVTEQDYMSFTSYILKNEIVIDSDNSGGIYYIADNAERVNPGDELAYVYENKIDESALKALEDTDSYIDILEKSIGDGVFTLREAEVKDSISKSYYSMMRAATKGNASLIEADADSFLIMLNQMNIFTGNSEELKNTLEKYKAKRADLKNIYSGANDTVASEYGGYFFRNTDGYEDIFTSSDISSLSYEGFITMTEKEPETVKHVGRLMLDYQWYLVIPTVKGISDTYAVGEEYTVSFPDSKNRNFKMKLYNVIPDSTGARSIMVFSCGIVDESFDYLRIQRVNITNRNVSGYRVPESAVCEIGGNTGVYILKDGMASFRKVIILYEGDGYYIVSADNSNSGDYYIYLEPNDNIITECKNMYEGKIIGG